MSINQYETPNNMTYEMYNIIDLLECSWSTLNYDAFNYKSLNESTFMEKASKIKKTIQDKLKLLIQFISDWIGKLKQSKMTEVIKNLKISKPLYIETYVNIINGYDVTGTTKKTVDFIVKHNYSDMHKSRLVIKNAILGKIKNKKVSSEQSIIKFYNSALDEMELLKMSLRRLIHVEPTDDTNRTIDLYKSSILFLTKGLNECYNICTHISKNDKIPGIAVNNYSTSYNESTYRHLDINSSLLNENTDDTSIITDAVELYDNGKFDIANGKKHKFVISSNYNSAKEDVIASLVDVVNEYDGLKIIRFNNVKLGNMMTLVGYYDTTMLVDSSLANIARIIKHVEDMVIETSDLFMVKIYNMGDESHGPLLILLDERNVDVIK